MNNSDQWEIQKSNGEFLMHVEFLIALLGVLALALID